MVIHSVKERTDRHEAQGPRLSYDQRENSYEAADIDDRLFVLELLDKIPQSLKDVVVLRYYSGLNSTEIGGILNTPSATVRTRLKTAMTLMKKNLIDMEG